jgi:two-component system, response regulator
MTAWNQVEILLVEDNPHDAEMTIHSLQERNLANKLVWVKDGAEALDFFFGTQSQAGTDAAGRPKVVLLDLKFPKVDGLGPQATQGGRADQRHPSGRADLFAGRTGYREELRARSQQLHCQAGRL